VRQGDPFLVKVRKDYFQDEKPDEEFPFLELKQKDYFQDEEFQELHWLLEERRVQRELQVQTLQQVQQEHLQLDLLRLRPSLRQALQPSSQQEFHLQKQKQFRQPMPLILLQLHQILQQPSLQELS
jgi:hypothetical protein